MSDQIKHECGLAFVRLLKPLDYYLEKYGTALYGINKLQLLMQKMRNRGQDGAGLATIKFDMPPGSRYISRKRSISNQYLKDLFKGVFDYMEDLSEEQLHDAEWLKNNIPFTGELLMGHLRYGTHGVNTIETCHPFLRQNNWISRNLVVAGNFNLTNVDELFNQLVSLGQNPKEKSDTVTVLEKIGHFLDDEVQRLYTWHKQDGYSNQEVNHLIYDDLNIQRILKKASKKFDGGYVIGGMIGHGDAFIMRDAAGIRPAFYYADDEVVVAASERPAIQTAFNVGYEEIHEVKPAHALIIKKDGLITEEQYIEKLPQKSCSFERIYFSRGTDRSIYLERKNLGKQLAERVMKSVEYDFENTVFSFVPNTAETAYYGLMEGLNDIADRMRSEKMREYASDMSDEHIKEICDIAPRFEKIVIKDAKMRTFIADEVVRADMVSHIYDITYGIVKSDIDTLVLIDDSIVRGTTLRDSIITICSKLKPKKIIVLSSAPQIRYPDCYGIDMSKMQEFVAFRAMIELLHEQGKERMIEEVYVECMGEINQPSAEPYNPIQRLYNEFTQEEISAKITELLTPPDINVEVEIIYQSLEGLHNACPHHTGDWYFSGNYPTKGGNKVVCKSFSNFMENKNVRAY